MLKRQTREAALCNPALREPDEACPQEPAGTWDLLRITLEQGLRSIDRRLEESGPLEPERFNVAEANERLAELEQRSFRS
jgi:hypothetical protein